MHSQVSVNKVHSVVIVNECQPCSWLGDRVARVERFPLSSSPIVENKTYFPQARTMHRGLKSSWQYAVD